LDCITAVSPSQSSLVEAFKRPDDIFDSGVPELDIWLKRRRFRTEPRRFAESTPDFSQVIGASGRYVSHGILFDTDSDRLKPESGAVIQMIAKGLQASAALKLLIEGHTDSSGDAAHNMDLSKRRAEAVKTVLVSQFQIDAARLTSAGLGSTKPMDKNDTPSGRALNRRVEFVKQ
jgi:outer membrane protein OmpA-like peptidoglycan-associated protein